MLGIVHGRLAIHKTPTSINAILADSKFSVPDDIDYNAPGWRISDLRNGLTICNNDWAPFWEAVNCVIALEKYFDNVPVKGTAEFILWTAENEPKIRPIIHAFQNW